MRPLHTCGGEILERPKVALLDDVPQAGHVGGHVVLHPLHDGVPRAVPGELQDRVRRFADRGREKLPPARRRGLVPVHPRKVEPAREAIGVEERHRAGDAGAARVARDVDAIRIDRVSPRRQSIDSSATAARQRGETRFPAWFGPHPDETVRIIRKGVGQDLQRDLAVELRVGGLPDLASSRQETPGAGGQCLCSLLAACFRGGATISCPGASYTPAPLRTGQAAFPNIRLLGESFSSRADTTAVPMPACPGRRR